VKIDHNLHSPPPPYTPHYGKLAGGKGKSSVRGEVRGEGGRLREVFWIQQICKYKQLRVGLNF